MEGQVLTLGKVFPSVVTASQHCKKYAPIFASILKQETLAPISVFASRMHSSKIAIVFAAIASTAFAAPIAENPASLAVRSDYTPFCPP